MSTNVTANLNYNEQIMSTNVTANLNLYVNYFLCIITYIEH